ncbi:MAG: hypothetical protein AAF941_02900 [Pseudomonadota bacterium]
MHPAERVDETSQANTSDGGYEAIVLVRPSGSSVRFEGVLLADAQNRTDHIAVWHELALYRKADGAFVVTVRMCHKDDRFEGALHVFNAQTFEAVMEIVERYSDSITCESLMPKPDADDEDDADEDDAETDLHSVVIDHQLKQIRRHYEAMVGDFLFATNRFRQEAGVAKTDEAVEAE